ncbi:MAG TPA: hypothetical protein VGE98_10540 [Thermoanaerobaculia bacterium]
MKTRWISTAALCALLFAAPSHLFAAGGQPTDGNQAQLDAKMAAAGWKAISPGVYERQRGPQKVEHLGYGREGIQWTVREMVRQVQLLQAEYKNYPSEELARVIETLQGKISDGRTLLRSAEDLTNVSAAVTGPGCSVCYSATADGYPLSGSAGQGVGAIADASFNSSCGQSGDTYAYAYARATLNGTTTTHIVEDPHTGTSVTSHASAVVNGASNCLSTANSYAQSTALGISYSTSDSNSSCPLPPPTISGPASATLVGTGCQTLTWTATTNGGVSPFSYSWTIDNTAAGTSTSTSVSKTYCGDGTNHSGTASVALTVTDSTSNSASATASTALSYTAGNLSVSISGPTSVSGVSAKTVTWTSSVSGGTTPYTYAWTVDGVSAGTSSSLSYTFYDSETAAIALSVTDAIGRTGSATYSTSVFISGGGGGCLTQGGVVCQ